MLKGSTVQNKDRKKKRKEKDDLTRSRVLDLIPQVVESPDAL